MQSKINFKTPFFFTHPVRCKAKLELSVCLRKPLEGTGTYMDRDHISYSE